MKKTVLLTDDEQSFLEPLSDALEYEGVNVLKARTVSEAIEVLKESNIDLITIDLMIEPGEHIEENRIGRLAGLYLCSYIREYYRDIDAICLSVVSDIDIIREIEKMGIKFIRKGETPLRTVLNIIRSKLTGVSYTKDFG